MSRYFVFLIILFSLSGSDLSCDNYADLIKAHKYKQNETKSNKISISDMLGFFAFEDTVGTDYREGFISGIEDKEKKTIALTIEIKTGNASLWGSVSPDFEFLFYIEIPISGKKAANEKILFTKHSKNDNLSKILKLEKNPKTNDEVSDYSIEAVFSMGIIDPSGNFRKNIPDKHFEFEKREMTEPDKVRVETAREKWQEEKNLYNPIQR